jgi:glutamate-1-semialdehyde 2,1-aminomutase
MAAGLAVLKELRPPVYEAMDLNGEKMRRGLTRILEDAGVNAFVGGMASFFHVIWTTEKVKDYRSAATGDKTIARFFSIDLMNRGIFLLGHPNVSAATTNEDIVFTLNAINESVETIMDIIKESRPKLLN